MRIGINGFGRIGRLTFRKLFDLPNAHIVAINDLASVEELVYLLTHDSVHGKWNDEDIVYNKNSFSIKGKKTLVYNCRSISDLPWKENNIDIVVEATGIFTDQKSANMHLESGAKKVIISAPFKDKSNLKTIVYNVNHEILTKDDKIISAASCTTNCLAPLLDVLKDFGVLQGWMTTVHAVTNDQATVDSGHRDVRRGRAAFINIVPTSTGAANAIGLVIPEMSGLLDGKSLRVPLITGSIVDLTIKLKQKVDVETINNAFLVKSKEIKETLKYSDKWKIVSSDIIGSTYGSIFDPSLTQVINDKENNQLVKVFSWYDNEMSYVSQLARLLNYFIKL
jgi:glyceraldehyde 3-phosphate dehydrogenase